MITAYTAEEIVTDVTPRPESLAEPEPARLASGTRHCRLLHAVGFSPDLFRTEPRSTPTLTPDARRAQPSRFAPAFRCYKRNAA